MLNQVLQLFKSISTEVLALREQQTNLVSDGKLNQILQDRIPYQILDANLSGAGFLRINSGGTLTSDSIAEEVSEAVASVTSFSGSYYFKGKKYTLSGAQQAFWYHDESDNTAHWSVGPMPIEMPNSQYWRTTASCRSIEYILC